MHEVESQRSLHLQFPGGLRVVSIFHLFFNQFSALLLLAFQLSYRIMGSMIFHTCVIVLRTRPPFRHTEPHLSFHTSACVSNTLSAFSFLPITLSAPLSLFRPLLPSHCPFIISPIVSFCIYSESGLVCITCRSPHPLSTK